MDPEGIEAEEESLDPTSPMPFCGARQPALLRQSKLVRRRRTLPPPVTRTIKKITFKPEKEISWIVEARKHVNSARPVDDPGDPCTIFRVPHHIRQLDDKVYDPVVVSIGPFHHTDPYSTDSKRNKPQNDKPPYCRFVQDHKWRCVWHLLSRHGSQPPEKQLLADCLLELEKKDSEVRSCYSEELPKLLNAHKLALIMLLDGCFIICLMLQKWKEMLKKQETTKEVVLNIGEKQGKVVSDIGEEKEQLEGLTVEGLFTVDLVVYDLLKLENQIPFFIIEFLFRQLKTENDGNIDLVDLALQLFTDIHPEESESFKKKRHLSKCKKAEAAPSEGQVQEGGGNDKYHHLLHLFYLSRIPAVEEPPKPLGCIRRAIKYIKSKCKKVEAASSQGSTQGTPTFAPRWIPSATELDRAGVKFKKNESADSFLNITFGRRKMKITPLLCLLKLRLMFRSGRMEIPPLQIYDYTRPLFQNLIAFEQCYLNTKMYITIYALFIDCIIDQPEDVRLLHLEGILEHKLSSDQEVAELFNKLGCQIHFSSEQNYLANQIESINKFYDFKWHKWLAGLRREYLGNPWAIISVLAAIFLLLLTVEQAVFSALSYVHSL